MGARNLRSPGPERGETPVAGPVSVRTRFERFPTSLKGAFLIRGADGNPHAIRVVEAAIARIPDGPSRAFPVEDRQIDVTPTRELFLPFEAPVSDLPPGWYAVQSSVEVDAGAASSFSSAPFSIPWPRGEVRRGTVPVGRAVEVDGRRFRIDRIEMAADATRVFWDAVDDAADAAEVATAVVLADGKALEVLPATAGSKPSARAETSTPSYPVPRTCRSVAVAIRLSSGRESEPVSVRLS